MIVKQTAKKPYNGAPINLQELQIKIAGYFKESKMVTQATQKRVEDLQELQIKIAEYLPIVDHEGGGYKDGSEEIKSAIKLIGDAIVSILCPHPP